MPNYNNSLKTIKDFIEMSYDSLSENKVDEIRGLFVMYGVKDYLEHHFKLMKDRGIETEDIFLGTWDFIAKEMKELNEDIHLLKDYKNE